MLVKLNVLETFYPEVSFNDIEGLEKQVLRALIR